MVRIRCIGILLGKSVADAIRSCLRYRPAGMPFVTARSLNGSLRLPAELAERVEDLRPHRRLERLGTQPAGEPDRLAHLVEVVRAAVAAREVPLERAPVVAGERVLEVVRHELD